MRSFATSRRRRRTPRRHRSRSGPAGGATVSAGVAVNATASDDRGVVGVQFLLDGSPLGAEDTTAPYGVAWDTLRREQRQPRAERDRARRGRQHGDVGAGHRHRLQRPAGHDAADGVGTAPQAGATVAGTVTLQARPATTRASSA